MPPAPTANFAHLLVSLGQSAFVALGEVAPPPGAELARDPAVARYNLAILEVLQHKTAGNLDPDEQRLIDTLVAELRAKLPPA